MKTGSRILGATLVVAASGLLVGCILPKSMRAHQEFVSEQVITNTEIESGFIENDAFKLHYRSSGKPVKAVVVWVHGTPGGWHDIGRLLVDKAFLSEVLLVSLDRPGWGLSQFKKTPRIVPRFSEQASLIKPLLSRLNSDYKAVPIILAGHSWGGSLVPYLGLEFPEIIDGIIVLAAGLDPDLVRPRWYNRAGKLVDGFLSESMSAANEEVYALVSELTLMDSRWPEIKVPVIVVQGDTDKLVNPKNADYAERKLNPKNSYILRLQDQGHLLQMERPDLIANCMLAMASNSLEDCR